MVHLIVAMTPGGIIGKNGTLPWHIPSDLKHFKTITSNSTVIMGRKTFDSLNMLNGLPNRQNFVITRTPIQTDNDVRYYGSLVQGISMAQLSESQINKSIFIIGGASIYKEALDKDLVDCMHISFVKNRYDGDTMFPNFDKTLWEEHDHIDMGEFIYVKYIKK